MHDTSMRLCQEFRDEYLKDRVLLSVADIGAYDVNGCYRPLFSRDGWAYAGFDKEPGPNVDHLFPPDDSHSSKYDVVISGQTLEHVAKPWKWICEVARLARPGGLIWIIAPNNFPFHGDHHYQDCWRVWPDGLRSLFDEAGLHCVYSRSVGIDTFGLAQRPG